MLTKTCTIASLLALATTSLPAAANPRHAAFHSSGDMHTSQSFLFAGPTLRLNLAGRGDRRPAVALRLAGGTHTMGMPRRIGEGLALSTSSRGKTRLTIHGQDSAELGRVIGMSDSGKTALIAGGAILLLGAVVLLAAGGAVDDANEDCCGSIND